jgi:serine/threonine-protein kinase
MGEVWAGENLAVGYKVAIKTMLEAASMDPEVVARFKREAFLLGRIRSDYVARVLDFVTDETYGLVLILDLIEGEVFSNTLKRTKLAVEEAIEVGADVVSGLVDLHHSNIVHRDLKPSNIILEPRRDGGQRAIIVDFGVSRLMKSDDPDEEITNITRADMALGTLEYMAPEQMLDSRNVTGASDLYAVGAMLYRAVKGTHAFGTLADIELARMKLLNDTPPLDTGRSDEVAKGFEAVVSRAVKRRPADRYKRAEEMLSDLLALRERMLHPGNPAAGRRPLPSLIEDEPTADTITHAVPIELSASFQVDRPPTSSGRASSPSAPHTASARISSPSAPHSSRASLTTPGTPGTPSAPPASQASPASRASAPSQPHAASHPHAASQPPSSSQAPAPSSSLPAPPPAATIDSTPPPARSGVSTGLVVMMVLAALVGGVAVGVNMATSVPASPAALTPSAEPSLAAPAASPSAPATAGASAPASSAGALDASISDAGAGPRDAAADAAVKPDASAPAPDASAPVAPRLPPKPAGGPLPGAPSPGGGPLPGAPPRL